jgi:hypothetical protein
MSYVCGLHLLRDLTILNGELTGRWRPNIAPLGAPTSLIKDDEYEGYKFPKGTVFTWNAWSVPSPFRPTHILSWTNLTTRAIALDEKEYPDPLRYYPERFLTKDLNNALQGHWGFGPGIPLHCTVYDRVF